MTSAEQEQVHRRLMGQALLAAAGNVRHPFGTVIADAATGAVIATGVNRSSENPMMHGEVDALMQLAESHWSGDRDTLVLYTTAEPCPMCMSAILWSGIPAVVFGTSIPALKALGWHQIDIRAADVIARSHRPECTLIAGIMRSECDALFQRAVHNSSENSTDR